MLKIFKNYWRYKMFKRIFFSSLFLITSLIAYADISYNYLQISHIEDKDDVSGINLDSSSIRVAGSYELNDSIFAFAEIEDGDFDDAPVDMKAHQFGIGIHTFE